MGVLLITVVQKAPGHDGRKGMFWEVRPQLSFLVIKSVKIESWYKNNVNEKYYIWLGDDIVNQYVLAVPNIPYEEKKISFDYMGLAIYKGKYEMIKYVVDVRDIDEQ